MLSLKNIKAVFYDLLFVLMTMLVTAHVALAAEEPVNQRDILTELYNNTDGDNWLVSGGWLEEFQNECDWYGVSCEDNQVTDIELINNQLNGTVPAAIYELPSLNNLRLSGNTLTGYSIGNEQACSEFAAAQFGGTVAGELSTQKDCFVDTPGRMVERRILTLDANTVVNFGLTFEGALLPLVGIQHFDETAENNLGDLLAVRFNPVGQQITGSVVLAPGQYVVFATTYGSNPSSPPIGQYSLTLNQSAQAQEACFLATYLVSEGSGVDAEVNALDCVLEEREDLSASELDRYYDQYTFLLPALSVLNVSIKAEFDFRVEHLVFEEGFDILLSTSPIVKAGQSRVFNLETVGSSANKLNVVAVTPGASGNYSLALDDYHEDQYDALSSLYNALGGGAWIDNTAWLDSEVEVCDWHGISCDEDSAVTEIDLSDNNLIGSLPSDLELLSRVETLMLSGNQINGAIPDTLAGMQELQSLALQNNQLTGTVPSAFYKNDELESLDVSGNSLSDNSITIEFAYTFNANQLGSEGDVLRGIVDGVMLDDSDLFEVVDVQEASLAGHAYVFGELSQWRSAREEIAPYLSLSGDHLDLWVCPAGFSNIEANDCSFGSESGFLISDHWPYNGADDAVHAGHPNLGDGFRDSDRPIVRENWVARVRTAQRVTLSEFYEALDGDNWANKQGWLDINESECDWYGVSCVDGEVTDIDLRGNQLSGAVPSEIFELPSLSNLSLSGNTVTGYAIGSESACSDYAAVQVGDVIDASLSNIDDCYVAAPGRMVERRTLTLENNTYLGFTLESDDFLPMVGVARKDESADNQVGDLLALRLNPFVGGITGEVALTSGEYIVFATSNDFDADAPPTGDYRLILSEGTHAQDGCHLATYLEPEGLAANGQISDTDCGGDGLHYDQFTFLQDIGSVLNVTVMADFEYRIDHLNDVGEIDNLLGSSDNIGAGQSRILNVTTAGSTTNKISIAAVNPDDTGDYFLALDDYFEDQLDALYSIYNALGGASWADNSGWLEDGVDECSWYGIDCNEDGIITAIDLSNNNLLGQLPRDLDLLSRVNTLDFSDNSIVAALPIQMAFMQDLLTLDLSNNLLSGNVPMVFADIEALDLSGNDGLGEAVLGDPSACMSLDDLPIGYSVTGVLTAATDCFGALGERLLDGFQLSLNEATNVLVTLTSSDFVPYLSLRNPGDETSAVTGSRIAANFAAEDTKTNEFVMPPGDFVVVASSAGTDTEAPPEGVYTLQTSAPAEPGVGCGVDTFVTFGSAAQGAVSAADCTLGPRDDIVGEEGTRYYDRYLVTLFADTPMYIEFESDFDYRIEHVMYQSGGAVNETLVADGSAGTEELFMVELDAFAIYSFVIVANEPDSEGNYTVSFSATEPVVVVPDEPSGAATPPVTETESSISDIENELDDIVVVEGEAISDELAQRVGDALNNAGAVARQLAEDLPEGSAGVDLALSALSTIGKSLQVSGNVRQQGGAVDDTAVVNSLGDVAQVFTAMSSRTGTLTDQQKQNVQGITDSTVTNSASMMREESSNDELVALVSATSAVINAAASAGAELTQELAQKTEQLVTKAIKTGMKSFAADIDTEDAEQVEQLLRTNPDALEFAVAASVAVTSRIKPDSGAIAAELAQRGVSADVSVSLTNVLDAVSNPDGVTVGGVSATEALLSALTQLFSGGDAAALQAGLNLLATSSGNAQIDVDPLTGGLIVTTPNEVYHGSAVSIRMVSNSMPKGISYMRDGRALVVADGLAIEIAPTPADLVGFTVAVRAAGFQLTMRNNGSLEITLGNGEYFSGALAYDNLNGLSGICGAISFIEPQGALTAPEYAFGIACANGITQRVTPFVHDNAFYTEMSKNSAKVQTDRNTGVLSIESVGKFKAGYFVTPLDAEQQSYFAENASGGIAIQAKDVNGDGINDIVLMTSKGGQALFGVDL